MGIDLNSMPGSDLRGTLDALDNGDGTTTLRARLSTIYLHPWALYPGFDCNGAPEEDSQLAVALPDIETGSALEIVDSSLFVEPMAAVVFEGPEDNTPVACGVLPALRWALPASGSAEPTPVEVPSARPTTAADVPAAITALIDEMEGAVTTGDRDGYLALVDLSDPVFATEHTRFADDWALNPPTEYELAVRDVVIDGSSARGVLSTTWAVPEIEIRTASLDVRFSQSSDGSWRYAGEVWATEEIEHFRVHVAHGLEAEMDGITDALPEVYEYATTALEYEPSTVMELKLYNGPAELVSTVRLGLPDIHGWNEPGESLKLRLEPEVPSLTPAIAHEFTHFMEFDRAGTQRSRMPWWLSEGTASLIGYNFEGPELGEFQLGRVRDWAASGELADWEDMAVFETTPMEIWPNAYAQGYVFSLFVSEIYPAERNSWLAAMSTEMDIEEATPTVLGLSFDALDRAFMEWLDDQP